MNKKDLEEEYEKLNKIVEEKRKEIKKDKKTLANIKAQIKGYELLEELSSQEEIKECLQYVSEPKLTVECDISSPQEYYNFIDAKLVFYYKYKGEDCEFVVEYTYSQTYDNREYPDEHGEHHCSPSNQFTDCFNEYLDSSYDEYELYEFIKKYH